MTADPARRRTFATLALGTACVAAADMAVATGCFWFLKGVEPARIIKGIAGGWVGRETAIAGGAGMVLLGAVSHLAIAAAMVVAYWAASRRWPALLARPIAYGLAYGVLTWATMKFVVVPLSALEGRGSPDLVWQWCHFASHLFIVGVPSAWLARRLAMGSPPSP